ncbi:MAG: hypothetical protein JWN10_2079 [Solirubrobacterales bacterium]|nr:hypothetical protein [Solirubrobacterales bacterium]
MGVDDTAGLDRGYVALGHQAQDLALRRGEPGALARDDSARLLAPVDRELERSIAVLAHRGRHVSHVSLRLTAKLWRAQIPLRRFIDLHV